MLLFNGIFGSIKTRPRIALIKTIFVVAIREFDTIFTKKISTIGLLLPYYGRFIGTFFVKTNLA